MGRVHGTPTSLEENGSVAPRETLSWAEDLSARRARRLRLLKRPPFIAGGRRTAASTGESAEPACDRDEPVQFERQQRKKAVAGAKDPVNRPMRHQSTPFELMEMDGAIETAAFIISKQV